MASWAASVLLGAITRVGRCTCSTSHAIVARLAGAGGAEQHDVLLAGLDPLGELGDRRRLVAAGLEVGDDLEGRHRALEVGRRAAWVNRTTPHRQGVTGSHSHGPAAGQDRATVSAVATAPAAARVATRATARIGGHGEEKLAGGLVIAVMALSAVMAVMAVRMPTALVPAVVAVQVPDPRDGAADQRHRDERGQGPQHDQRPRTEAGVDQQQREQHDDRDDRGPLPGQCGALARQAVPPGASVIDAAAAGW